MSQWIKRLVKKQKESEYMAKKDIEVLSRVKKKKKKKRTSGKSQRLVLACWCGKLGSPSHTEAMTIIRWGEMLEMLLRRSGAI